MIRGELFRAVDNGAQGARRMSWSRSGRPERPNPAWASRERGLQRRARRGLEEPAEHEGPCVPPVLVPDVDRDAVQVVALALRRCGQLPVAARVFVQPSALVTVDERLNRKLACHAHSVSARASSDCFRKKPSRVLKN